MNKAKLLGQTFTEYKEVSHMISLFRGDITASKIMEPSFGDGAFLIEIVRKIVLKARKNGLSDNQIKLILEENVFGFEIDNHFFNLALENLGAVLKDLNFTLSVNFKNLINSSAFTLKSNEKFDLIIGNPPYVRIQNFDEGINKVKKELSRTVGNTDLYLMFIDFFLSRIADFGQMILIVPNSFGKSKSAFLIRDWMMRHGAIDYIDFESRQLFAKASVYSCIFNFKNNSRSESFFRVDYSGKKMKMLTSKVFEPIVKEHILPDLCVKNGIATLADDVFIFKNEIFEEFEKEFIIPTYKASRVNEKYYSIFPYKIIGEKIIRLSEEDFAKNAPNIFKYLLKHKNKLSKRSLEKGTNWYEYGRTQAIKDVNKSKYVIDTLIKPGDQNLKIRKVHKKSLVFSGLYSTKPDIENYNNAELIKLLRFRAKDMRGGYKKISSSLLKNNEK